jgi:kynurenine formamidase
VRRPLGIIARCSATRREALGKTVGMSVLTDLIDALSTGSVVAIDLTAPLSAETPLLELPPEFGQTARFELEEISRYDDRGPAWYWNNFHTGEHTGTHFDAPVHWVTGKDKADVASVPVSAFVAPAVVIDAVDRVADDPDFLLEVDHLEAFVAEHGPLPAGGWLLCRTGWSSRTTQQEMVNRTDAGPTSPGMSAECARWVAEVSPLQGIGVETIGTDAGAAHSFDPPFPCHAFLLGNGKYGLAQLQNLHLLPPTGAVVVAAPLRIVGGSGSPVRVVALVER